MGVTSGSFETSHRISGSYNTYAKFSWSQSSQSVANNSTTITWKLVGCTANQYQWIHVYGISVTINGTAQSVSWSGDMYNGTQMASGTVTIPHNADGTKTFSASASIHQYSTASSDWYSGSGSWTLNQIARAATISSAPNFNDEANPTITYNNAAGTAVSTLQACIASTDGQTVYVPYRDISKTGTSYTFSLTESERNTLRAACTGNSMNVRFYIKTVIGSTTLYDSVQKTLSIVNANPTFSNFTYSDTNSTITAITGNNQYLVQGKSTLQVQVSTANKATAKKSATMSSYQSSISGLTANGTYSSSAAVNMTFSSNAFTPGSQTLAVKAIDSRGNSTSVSKSVNVLAYAAPTISASATRANNFENDTTLHIEGAYSPLTISGTAKNTVSSVQYRYKQQSTSTWGSWTNMSGLNVTSAGRYTTTNIVLSLDNSYAWDVQVKTVDRLSTTTVSLVVSAGIAIFRIGTDGYVYNQEHRLLFMTDLTGKVQTAAYRRGVIALCKVSTTDSTYLDSWTSGRIAFHRDNGLAGIAEIRINMENAWYAGYGTNVSYTSNVPLLTTSANLDTDLGFRPCSFKYNNVWYGGIEVAIADANLGIIRYEGLGNFNIFGLDYYIRQTSGSTRQILNSEVYNSLIYNKWTKARGTWYT